MRGDATLCSVFSYRCKRYPHSLNSNLTTISKKNKTIPSVPRLMCMGCFIHVFKYSIRYKDNVAKVLKVHCIQMPPTFTIAINSSLPWQNVRCFADDILKCVLIDKIFVFRLNFRRIFIRKGSIKNKSALFEVMAWRRTGDKPLP